MLAVNIPPQEPTPGQAWRSISSNSAESMRPALNLAHRFERAHDGEIFAVEVAGLDGAAIDKDRGNVQARDGDHGAGHVFVAAADGHQAVDTRGAANGFDGVGDDFARDQRILHPLGAHGDAVADGDGAEDLRHGLRLRASACMARAARSLSPALQGVIVL